MTGSLFVEHFDDLIATSDDVDFVNRVIVQLALHGKIVEQDQNDEPASEQIKRLQTAKEKIIQPLDIKDEPYKLPSGWLWFRTGDIFEIVGGGTPSTKEPEYWDGDIPWITSADILEPKLIRIRKTITEAGLEHSATNLVPAQSIIVVTRVGLGKVGINNVPLCISQDSHALIENLDFIYPDYALYCLLEAAQSFRGKSRGTTIIGITRAQLENVPIPLPPYQEQIRITQKIEQLFAQTSLLAEQLTHSRSELDGLNKSALSHLLASETSEEFDQHWAFIAEHFDLLFQTPEHVAPLRQSILELAVRGKLTRRDAGDEPAKELLQCIQEEKEKPGKTALLRQIKEEEKPFDLPQGWEWTSWDDVSLQIGDVDHKMPDEIPDGIPYISPRDFTGKEDISFATAKKISQKDYDDLAEKIKPERGDIIFPRYGTIGVNRFVSVDFQFLASYSCCIIKHMKGLMNPRYVFFYSISPFLRQETQKYVNKTTQPNVGIKSIQQFLFPLPPLAEQERIVKRVEQLLSLCDALEARLRSAQEERGRLVAAVMAGVGA